MEDDDLAVVSNGALTIHRTQHEVIGQSTIREIIELKIELQEIMKGTNQIHNYPFPPNIDLSTPVRKLQIFHAEGNLRTARISGEYDAWSSEFHYEKSSSWRNQRLHRRDSSLSSFDSHCVRHQLSLGSCYKTTAGRAHGITRDG